MRDRHGLWRTALLCAVLGAAPATVLAGGMVEVDDFEDGDLESSSGLSWIVIADDLMGGASNGELSTGPGAGGSRGALVLSGELAAGAPVPFVGAWSVVAPQGLARDLSRQGGLRLRVRGTAGIYHGGVRTAGAAFNFMAPFEAGPDWRVVEIPFEELRPVPPQEDPPEWDAGNVAWVGVTRSGTPGPFRLELDDVAFYEGKPTLTPVSKVRLAAAGPLQALPWRALGEDPGGDGTSPRLPDAAELAWAPGGEERIWFRIRLHGVLPAGWLGVNLAFDLDGDPGNGMAWWGANDAFRFDRLATAYLSRAVGYWQGWIGVGDAEGVARGLMDTISRDVRVAVDRDRNAIFLGLPRGALGEGGSVRLIATVGSSMINNDDLPDRGAFELVLPRVPGT